MNNKRSLALINGITHLIIVLAFVGSSAIAKAQKHWADLSEEQEYQVKAIFLYNFANFVQWPPAAFDDGTKQLRMCIFGHAPFGVFLDSVDKTLIRDKVLTLIRTNDLNDINMGCHILFVSDDKREYIDDLITSTKHTYVLSVSDVKGFARKGGAINIVRTFDNLNLEINLDAVLNNGLYISSDLLSLATIVTGD